MTNNASTGSYSGSVIGDFTLGRTQNHRGCGSYGGVSKNSVINVPNLPRIIPNWSTDSTTNDNITANGAAPDDAAEAMRLYLHSVDRESINA
ncbi:hypothetical protein SNK03_007885 [Fusarium graminearum]